MSSELYNYEIIFHPVYKSAVNKYKYSLNYGPYV
jgi:hypothetical protein